MRCKMLSLSLPLYQFLLPKVCAIHGFLYIPSETIDLVYQHYKCIMYILFSKVLLEVKNIALSVL